MKKNKKKINIEKQKNIWYSVLIIGIIFCAIPVAIALKDAIFGTTRGICMFDCTTIYGLEAFRETFLWMIIFLSPICLIGFAMVVVSGIFLMRLKK